MTQLRPAARELSPTLTELAGLAPDLNAFFRDLDPLIKASRTGIPAAQRILEDLRPLLAQLDPAGRQLVPIVDFLALYKSEITRSSPTPSRPRRRATSPPACTTCARRTR